MNAILLLGAPGSGKGTTADGIGKQSAFIHVATGDMLRAALKNGTELGLKAEGYMKKGELVPDDVIIGLVEERLDAGSVDDAYMFDGFPRTTPQAELLEQSLTKRGATLSQVFYLDAPRELLIKRLCGRRICRDCGANFHVENIPPKKEGVCDLCSGELYQRADDHVETIVNRLEVFNRQTESLIALYEQKGVLVRVDSSRHRDLIIEEIVNLLKA